MDDVGTGYSSLSYLHSFAFDFLKSPDRPHDHRTGAEPQPLRRGRRNRGSRTIPDAEADQLSMPPGLLHCQAPCPRTRSVHCYACRTASCPTRKCLLHKDLLLSKHGAAHAVFRHPTLNLRLTNSPSGTVWIFLDDSQTPARIAAAMLMSMQQLVSSAVSVDPPVLRTCSPIFALSAKNLLDRTTTAWKATWRCRPHGLGLSAVLQLRSCAFGPAPSRWRVCAPRSNSRFRCSAPPPGRLPNRLSLSPDPGASFLASCGGCFEPIAPAHHANPLRAPGTSGTRSREYSGPRGDPARRRGAPAGERAGAHQQPPRLPLPRDRPSPRDASRSR